MVVTIPETISIPLRAQSVPILPQTSGCDRIGSSASCRRGTFEFSAIVQQIVYLWKKYALRIEKGISIAEDKLELLDWPQRSPNACAQSYKTDRPTFKAFGELQHIDEVLEDARNASIIFR